MKKIVIINQDKIHIVAEDLSKIGQFLGENYLIILASINDTTDNRLFQVVEM